MPRFSKQGRQNLVADVLTPSLVEAGVDQQKLQTWQVPGVRSQVVDFDDPDPESPHEFEGHGSIVRHLSGNVSLLSAQVPWHLFAALPLVPRPFPQMGVDFARDRFPDPLGLLPGKVPDPIG